MRTTITLDDDAEQVIRRRMHERGSTFKEAVNDAIRESAAIVDRRPFRTETASLGQSKVNLDRALRLAGDLEDDDLVRRSRSGS